MNNAGKLRIWAQRFALVAVMGLAFSGCIGGCIVIPPVTIPVTVLNDATIPGLPIDGLPLNRDFNLPQLCDFPSLSELEETVQNSAVGFLANRVEIKDISVTNITFDASAGSFASFQTVTMSLVIGDQVTVIGTGSPNQDGTKIILTSDNPPNLYALLKDVPEGTCINGRVTIAGTAPTQNITFDLTMQVRVEVSLT